LGLEGARLLYEVQMIWVELKVVDHAAVGVVLGQVVVFCSSFLEAAFTKNFLLYCLGLDPLHLRRALVQFSPWLCYQQGLWRFFRIFSERLRLLLDLKLVPFLQKNINFCICLALLKFLFLLL
jgi:hypothetical protein